MDARTTCNLRAVGLVTKGPATEALERSLKRKRSTTCSDDKFVVQSFPSLDKVFAVLPGEQDFPSIGWDFDDVNDDAGKIDSTQDIHRTLRLATDTAASYKRLRTHNLARSKSFRTDLCAMNSGVTTSLEGVLSTKVEPLPPLGILDIQFSLNFEPRSILANSTSSGKRFSHNLLPPVGCHLTR
jgi:hypothetical protein